MVPYLLCFSIEKDLVDVFNPEASCLVVQDEPPRDHSIRPLRRLHDAAESKEVNLLETRLRVRSAMLRERRDRS